VYNVIIVIYDNVTNMSSTYCPGHSPLISGRLASGLLRYVKCVISR